MAEEAEELKAKRFSLRDIGLSETLIIAAVPALAYLLTFALKSGYLSFFHIPSDYITFSVAEILIASAVLVSFVGIAFSFGNLLYSVWALLPERIRAGALGDRLKQLLFVIFVYGAIYLLFPDLRSTYLKVGFVIGLAALAALQFILPLCTHRDAGSYLDKLEAADASSRQADREVETLVDRLLTSIDRKLVLGLLLMFALVYLAWGVGRYRAISQESFYVVNTSPEAVVLQTTTDYVICAPFDRVSQEIEPAFQILKNGEDQSLVFRLESVGPLVPWSVAGGPSSTAPPSVTPSGAVP
jgi:hypothetical protein